MKIQYFALSDESSSEILSLEIYFRRLDSKVIFIFFSLSWSKKLRQQGK